MVTVETARNLVGIVGNLISFGLFLSPVPTFYKIIKKRSVEEYTPYSYIATAFNCMCWTFYGMPFVQPDRILVITCYGVGLVLELIYLAIFFAYSDKEKRKTIGLHLVGQVLFMAIVALITMTIHDTINRSLLVGLICYISNVIVKCLVSCFITLIVYGSKSVEHMSFTLSLINFLNDCVWTAYALINKLDVYILLSNGEGAICGLVQLVSYACYFRTTPSNN